MARNKPAGEADKPQPREEESQQGPDSLDAARDQVGSSDHSGASADQIIADMTHEAQAGLAAAAAAAEPGYLPAEDDQAAEPVADQAAEPEAVAATVDHTTAEADEVDEAADTTDEATETTTGSQAETAADQADEESAVPAEPKVADEPVEAKPVEAKPAKSPASKRPVKKAVVAEPEAAETEEPGEADEEAADEAVAESGAKARAAKGEKTRRRSQANAVAAPKKTSLGMFIGQVVQELKKVVWPSGSQLRQYFLIVLLFVLFLITFIGLLDLLFGWVLVKGIG